MPSRSLLILTLWLRIDSTLPPCWRNNSSNRLMKRRARHSRKTASRVAGRGELRSEDRGWEFQCLLAKFLKLFKGVLLAPTPTPISFLKGKKKSVKEEMGGHTAAAVSRMNSFRIYSSGSLKPLGPTILSQNTSGNCPDLQTNPPLLVLLSLHPEHPGCLNLGTCRGREV